MPPICGHCKEVGQKLKRCKVAPTLYSNCNSTSHVTEKCPKQPFAASTNSQSRRLKAKQKKETAKHGMIKENSSSTVLKAGESTLGNAANVSNGESSCWVVASK